MDYSDSEDELDTLDQSNSKLNRKSNSNHQRIPDSQSPLIPETELSDQSPTSSQEFDNEGGGGGGFTIEIDPPKPKRNSTASNSNSKPKARVSKDHFDLNDAFGNGGKQGRNGTSSTRDVGDEVDDEKEKANDSESSLSDLDFLTGKAEKKPVVKKTTSMRKTGQAAATSRKSQVKKEEDGEEEGDGLEGYNGTGFPTSKSNVKKKAPVPKGRAIAGHSRVYGRGGKSKVKEESASEDDKSQEDQDSTSETEEAMLQQAIAASLGKSFDQKKGQSSSKKASTPNVTRSGRTLKAPTDPRGIKRSRGEAAGGNESNWDEDSSEEDEDFGFTSEDDESHFDDELPDEGVSEDENIFKESRAEKKSNGKGRGKSTSTSPIKGKGKAPARGRPSSKIMDYDEEDEDESKEEAQEEGEEEEAPVESEDEESDVPLIKRRSKPASRKQSVASGAGSGSAFSEAEDSDDDVTSQVTTSTQAPKAKKRGGGGFIVDDDDEDEPDVPEVAGPSNWQQLQQQASNSTQGGFPGSGRALGGAGGVGGDVQEEQRYETAIQRTRREKREAREAKRLARRGGKRLKKRSQYEKTRDALNQNHPELEHVWRDLKNMGAVVANPLPQPDGLTVKLLPFQREGLGWLVRQEQSHWSGGMLADEMVSRERQREAHIH